MKKSPPQAKKFWGPFFKKFEGLWKKVRKINGFNGFQIFHTEKKLAVGEKFDGFLKKVRKINGFKRF